MPRRRRTPAGTLPITPISPSSTPFGFGKIENGLLSHSTMRGREAGQQTQTGGLIAALGADVYPAWVGDESFVEAARRTATSRRRRTPAVSLG
jgi:hypothetical protein